jgi:hypothetical protein
MSQNLPHQRLHPKDDETWEEIIATIPQESQDLMLEVALVHSGMGGSVVELRSLVWGTGLGWYRQSTLRLDKTAAQKLLSALGSVRRCLDPAKPSMDSPRHEARVLPFPGPFKAATPAHETPSSLAQ